MERHTTYLRQLKDRH